LCPAFAIKLGQRRTFIGIKYDDELPALGVATGWPLQSNLDAIANDIRFYRFAEIESFAYSSCGGKQFVCT
jgi:hypothetical protein